MTRHNDRIHPISIHAPTRGATRRLTLRQAVLAFQSTLPQGERRTAAGTDNHDTKFHSTLPQGERQCVRSGRRVVPLFQSTLPQGERLTSTGYVRRDAKISIHAPTRGATLTSMFLSTCSGNFNPRSHKGSDYDMVEPDDDCRISIHAPTRGATNSFITASTIF